MKAVMRIDSVVDDYIARGDHSNENSNMGWGPNGMLFAVGEEALRRDFLVRLKEEGHTELAELHEKGGVHIHDLGLGFNCPYCSGWSLSNLLDDGISAGAVHSKPARHFRTAINHIVNFIGAASNEFAGAQAFNDFDLLLAPLAYKCYLDFLKSGVNVAQAFKLAKKEIKQSLQELLFHLNYTNRWGGQSPFSNLTLAITCPDDMKDSLAMIAGKPLHSYYPQFDDNMDIGPTTYGMLSLWQHIIVDTMLDIFMDGDASGRGFTFPVITINITPEFFDTPVRHKIFELTAKYGTPYFQNFINGISGGEKIDPKDVRAMCCRLQLSKSEIRKHVGGIFGNGDQTGSLQVVTLSLPYWAAQAVAVAEANPTGMFFKLLDHTIDLIAAEQRWKREKVITYLEKGFFQMAANNLKRGFDTYFSTVGFIGLWEAVCILMGDLQGAQGFFTQNGMALAKNILEFLRTKTEDISGPGQLCNLEATPAEGASYKLAKKALKQFPHILHQGTRKAPYFTNSCHIPVEYQDDLMAIIATQTELQTIPTGGTVTHIYCGEEMTAESVETAVKMLCQTSMPYFSLTTVFSICPICGRVPGAHEYCPHKHSPEQLQAYHDSQS